AGGGYVRGAVATADIAVPGAPRKFVEEARAAVGGAARRERHRLLEDRERAAAPADQQEAEPDPPAQPPHTGRFRRQPAGAARGARHREIDTLADRQPVDALQHERQREAQFQFDDDRRRVAAVCDEIAAIDLALHIEAAFLAEPLDRQIERSFAERGGFAYRALSHGRVAAVPMLDRTR